MKQHKWHKEIKAWADGAEIEQWYGDRWEKVNYNHDWNEKYEYRIKPQPKEPQFEEYITPYADVNIIFKPQPKEPQYLYVYLDDNYEFSPIPLTGEWEYIGKIKLEVEDE